MIGPSVAGAQPLPPRDHRINALRGRNQIENIQMNGVRSIRKVFVGEGADERFEASLIAQECLEGANTDVLRWPKMQGVDHNSKSLMFEYIDGDSFRAISPIDENHWGDAEWAGIGRSLAELHQIPVSNLAISKGVGAEVRFLSHAVDGLPWSYFLRCSRAEVELWGQVQTNEILVRTIRATNLNLASSGTVCVSHGDMRLDQIIVGHDGSINMVDWEESCLSAPELDLGDLVGEVIFSAVVNASWSSSAARSLTDAFAKAGAVAGNTLRSYRLNGGSWDVDLLSSVIAVHLVDRAIAHAAKQSQVGNMLRMVIGVATCFSEDPSDSFDLLWRAVE